MGTQKTDENAPRIAVVGGGITGLAAAHRLQQLVPQVDVTLFEAGERLGGVIHTQRHKGLLIEESADMFTTREPWALDLCRRIGLESELVETNEAQRQAFVVHRGRLVPVPKGFLLMRPTRLGSILTTSLLSPAGKLRLAAECLIPRRSDAEDESLASFARRRLGREAYERLVQPLIGGIYTSDPEKLSMQATMAQFVDMERQYGSLLRGSLRQRRSKKQGKRAAAEGEATGARYGMFVAPREGLSQLIDRLAAYLPGGTVQLNRAVTQLRYSPDGWQVQCGEPSDWEIFSAVILALPARRSAKLLEPLDSELAAKLGAIEYASVAIAACVFSPDQFSRPLRGFGYVAPIVEGRRVLACSFASHKFPDRAPSNRLILRAFLGGALQPDIIDLPDEEITRLVQEDVAELLGVRGPPKLVRIIRWRDAMPQYHVGHLQRVEQIEALAGRHPGLALAGNAYRGVGIPFCVHSGQQAAERVLQLAPS